MRLKYLGLPQTLIAVVALVTTAGRALAGDPVGHIFDHAGTVAIGADCEQGQAVAIETPVVVGACLIVDADGRATVAFADGVRAAVGPGSAFWVRSYQRGPEQPRSGDIDLLEGAARVTMPERAARPLGFVTSTAHIDGHIADWTMVAEETTTLIRVHRGRVVVQPVDHGRGPRGRAVMVQAPAGVAVPWGTIVASPPPRPLTAAEAARVRSALAPD